MKPATAFVRQLRYPAWLCGLVLVCLLAGWGAPTALRAQVRLQRFVPGSYLTDNLHLVELQNVNAQAVNLGGWLVVTRDYSVLLPNHNLAPGAIYRIGKERTPSHPLNLQLLGHNDFLIRLYRKQVEGNYAALFAPDGRFVDGFYHSQLPNVPFLPDTGSLIRPNGQRLRYDIPAETTPGWGYFSIGEDPAIGFVRLEGQWRVTSANPTVNLYPATAFRDLKGRYSQGVVSLSWVTEFEDGVRTLIVERSRDQKTYAAVGNVAGQGQSRSFVPYTWTDDELQPGQTYYYRLRHTDAQGQTTLSKVLEIRAEEPPIDFWLEIFPEQPTAGQAVSIRFFSAYTQQVKIKLLDANYREVFLLFHSLVYADSQHLLKLTETIPPGQYTLIATTEGRRLAQSLKILK